MRERLIKFLESENLSSARFADDIGVQRSSISHILSGRNNPSFEFIQKILAKYKFLNAEWLIMGTGNMIKTVVQGNLFEDIPVGASNVTENQTAGSSVKVADTSSTQNAAEISNNPEAGHEIFSSHETKDSPSSVKEILSDSESQKVIKNEKLIEKILIMYSDKTFTLYSPSN